MNNNDAKLYNIFTYKDEQSGHDDKILSDRDAKISKTTKQLEELFRIRELQKNKMKNFSREQTHDDHNHQREKIRDHYYQTKNRSQYTRKISSPVDSFSEKNAEPSDIISDISSTIQNEIPIRTYSYLWDAYWPFNGSCDIDPKLDIELDYLTFNGTLMEKWAASLPTPATTIFPMKDIFNLTLISNNDDFDFDIKMENLPTNGNPIVIDINPDSSTFPFNLNQYVLIKDPNITVTSPGDSPTDVLAIMAYYNSNEIYLNQFMQTMDIFDPIKNILLSTQIFFMHINHIRHFVKLNIVRTTTTGENLFNVVIETNNRVEIKEIQIPVQQDHSIDGIDNADVGILVRTVYINGKYFMTYATYINDISIAQQLPNISGAIADLRQTPLQLATMLLFEPIIPLANLGNVIPSNDQQRLLVKMFKEILQKNP